MDTNLNDIKVRIWQWERNFLPIGTKIAPDTLGMFIAMSLGVYIAERLDTIIDHLDEPIDSHPAAPVERYSGCGEDIEQHEVGRCPLCQRPWAECDCGTKAER